MPHFFSVALFMPLDCSQASSPLRISHQTPMYFTLHQASRTGASAPVLTFAPCAFALPCVPLFLFVSFRFALFCLFPSFLLPWLLQFCVMCIQFVCFVSVVLCNSSLHKASRTYVVCQPFVNGALQLKYKACFRSLVFPEAHNKCDHVQLSSTANAYMFSYHWMWLLLPSFIHNLSHGCSNVHPALFTPPTMLFSSLNDPQGRKSILEWMYCVVWVDLLWRWSGCIVTCECI